MYMSWKHRYQVSKWKKVEKWLLVISWLKAMKMFLIDNLAKRILRKMRDGTSVDMLNALEEFWIHYWQHVSAKSSLVMYLVRRMAAKGSEELFCYNNQGFCSKKEKMNAKHSAWFETLNIDNMISFHQRQSMRRIQSTKHHLKLALHAICFLCVHKW